MAPGNCTATEGLACEGWTPSSRQDKIIHTRIGKDIGSKLGVLRQRKWAKAPPTKFPQNDGCGRRVSTSQSGIAKQAAAVGQARCWRVESNSADSDVDPKRMVGPGA